MTRRKIDQTPQRELALRLRYHIDQAIAEKTGDHVGAIAELIRANPTSARSSHVRHNLGKERLKWLAERGLA